MNKLTLLQSLSTARDLLHHGSITMSSMFNVLISELVVVISRRGIDDAEVERLLC